MKNTSVKSLLVTAAMTGLLSVGMPAFASAHASRIAAGDGEGSNAATDFFGNHAQEK